MRARVERMQKAGWAAVFLFAVFGSSLVPVAAAPSFAQGSAVKETAAQRAAREQAEDDEDDAFFSGGSNRNTTETIANAAPTQTRANAQPSVDVAATCRAVLADNLNYYNYNFIEGCKRAVAFAGPRRIMR